MAQERGRVRRRGQHRAGQHHGGIEERREFSGRDPQMNLKGRVRPFHRGADGRELQRVGAVDADLKRGVTEPAQTRGQGPVARQVGDAARAEVLAVQRRKDADGTARAPYFAACARMPPNVSRIWAPILANGRSASATGGVDSSIV